MREEANPAKELLATKYQLARLAYDIFQLNVYKEITIPFDDLDSNYKKGWVEAAWAVVEVGDKRVTKIAETVTVKQQDNGYLVYAGCKELKKSHPNLFTYSKFPEHIMQMYRDLAYKIYQKIDTEEEEVL